LEIFGKSGFQKSLIEFLGSVKIATKIQISPNKVDYFCFVNWQLLGKMRLKA